MNFKKVAGFVGLVASSVLAVSTSPAQAFNLNSGSNLGTCSVLSDPFVGAVFGQLISQGTTGSCTTADGFTLTASGGNLQGKNVNGFKGIGVTSDLNTDPTLAEINFGESISMTVPGATGGILGSIDFSAMFQPGVFSDEVFEVAEVVASVFGGGTYTGTLRITGNNTALWNVGGLIVDQVVNAISPSTPNGGGYYSVSNPFANLAVTNLLFRPTNGSSSAASYVASNVGLGSPATSYQNSDFGVGGVALKSVPEPTTLAGLGIVGSLLVASRRRRANAAS